MWNIIFGIICIVGGLSGKLALRGTDSGQALAVVGGALLVWGIVQVVKSRQEQPPAESESEGNDADR